MGICYSKKWLSSNATLPLHDGKKRRMYVERIKDGDTLVVIYPTRGCLIKPYRYNIRLAHVDTPELRPIPQPNAIEAKEFTAESIGGKYVDVLFVKKDKYGRELAEIYYKKGFCCYVTVHRLDIDLLKSGLAVPYEGGKRK